MSTPETPIVAPAGGPLGRAAYGVHRALTFWRRSVQARVVASTVLLSAAVVGIVGAFLIQQTRDGLVDNRVAQVIAEAENETAEARDRLSFARGTDVNESSQQEDLVKPIIRRGASRGFAVILSPPSGGRLDEGGAEFTEGLDFASVPESMQQHFEEKAPTAWTFTTI